MVGLSLVLVLGGIGDDRAIVLVKGFVFFEFFGFDRYELNIFILIDGGLVFFGDL